MTEILIWAVKRIVLFGLLGLGLAYALHQIAVVLAGAAGN